MFSIYCLLKWKVSNWNFHFRTELCWFCGAKIYPGRGIRFIRSDSQVIKMTHIEFWVDAFLYLNRSSVFATMCSMFVVLINASFFVFLFDRFFYLWTRNTNGISTTVWSFKAHLTWAAMYRKQHKKVNFLL
jgi:hypothetical protein